MKSVHISTQKHLPRRTFLKAAGAAMALPALDAMRPAFARADPSAVPRRMIAINVDLGFMPELFFPQEAGREFKPTPYLKPLAKFRDQLTVFSGVSHPEVDGGVGGLVEGLQPEGFSGTPRGRGSLLPIQPDPEPQGMAPRNICHS